MPTRPYTSSVRTAAAAEKRERVIEAAARSLRDDSSLAAFSLEAMATDPDFAQALLERNERRRKAVNVLVRRIAEQASPRARRDAVDIVFALTSFAMFAMLRRQRSADEVCGLIKTACRGALDPLSPARPANRK